MKSRNMKNQKDKASALDVAAVIASIISAVIAILMYFGIKP
ncbi:hypothetical protein OZX58_02255 [Lactobacillus sp. ESL0680]|nr:hypothetical protein [Lactobacillus sp. ESL0680]WEV39078.1 hypothetical protein OZX58_02255 [Lactobacillus sp. ESL0680]